MDLGSAFAVSVWRQPGQIAVVEGNTRLSYADWYRQIKAVAGGLREMGLRPGDHFVVVMRNRYDAESGAMRTPIPAQGGQHSGDCGQRVIAA